MEGGCLSARPGIPPSQESTRFSRRIQVKGAAQSPAENAEVSNDNVQTLISRQLTAWEEDPRLLAGQLYLVSPLDPKEIQVRSTGDVREAEGSLLQSFIRRASSLEPGSFEDVRDSERVLVYSLSHSDLFQGLWLLFPGDPYASLEAWSESAQRFSREFWELSNVAQGEPPTFQQIADAFPSFEASEASRGEKPHWESSRTQSFTPTDLELTDSLLLDHRPVF